MKIVLFGAEFTMTGAGLMLCRWAEHLAAAGHAVSILLKDQTPGPLRERFGAAGISVVEGNRASIDSGTLVICNTIDMAPQIIQSAPYTRTIWWIHEAEYGVRLLGDNPQLARAFAAADAVIFPARHLIDSTYRDFLSGLPAEKFHVAPCGIDMPAEGRRRQAASAGPIRVLSVGSIYPRKRHGDLIKAVGMLDDLNLECVLAGRLYDLDDESKRLIHNRPDRFRLLGELPNDQILALIDSAPIFALPSEDEAMPLVTFEAGARGRSLLLSDLGCYEGLWRHGHNCLMHPVGDVGLLADRLRILATDPGLRDRLGAEALRTTLPYTIDHMLSQLDQVIATVCPGGDLPGRRTGPDLATISRRLAWTLR